MAGFFVKAAESWQFAAFDARIVCNQNQIRGIAVERLDGDRSTLARHVREGKAVRIARGLYVNERPQPRDLARLLLEIWPGALLTGESVAQVVLGEELTFPLHLSAQHRLPSSEFVAGHRSRIAWGREHDGMRIHLPVLALKFLMDEDLGRRMLERFYDGHEGNELLKSHLDKAGLLPARVRRLIETAAVGTDSGAEAMIVRELRERGVRVQTNYVIGPYRWDIVIPGWKVAIEIDSREFHIGPFEFVRDRWKNNDAVLRGWTTLRYTGSCVAFHRPAVLQQILEARRPNFSAYFFEGVWKWHEVFRRATGYEGELLGFER